jgi:hypothetical protein
MGMPEPIVFISHFSINEGRLEQVMELSHAMSAHIEASKPRTLVYLSFLDSAQGTVSFLHAFADADAMDHHFEGSGDRTRAASEFVEPRGWEVYGTPSDAAHKTLRDAAAAAGTSLTVQPHYLAGFLRLGRGG